MHYVVLEEKFRHSNGKIYINDSDIDKVIMQNLKNKKKNMYYFCKRMNKPFSWKNIFSRKLLEAGKVAGSAKR